MARRSKKEMRAEYERLSAIFETHLAFLKARFPEDASVLDGVTPKQTMLDAVDAGEATMSEIIAGVQQALNDFNLPLTEFDEDDPTFLQDFLAFYADRHDGRNYWDDVGHPVQLARKILRRGRITNETEWYLINEIMTDVDQQVFSEIEKPRIAEMMRWMPKGKMVDKARN